MMKMKEYKKAILSLFTIFLVFSMLGFFGISPWYLSNTVFLLLLFSPIYFGYKFSSKYNFIKSVVSSALISIIILSSLLFTLTIKNKTEINISYLLAITIVFVFLTILSSVGYLLNKKTRILNLTQNIKTMRIQYTWEAFILLFIAFSIYSIIDYQVFNLLIEKKIPIDFYKQYAQEKNIYNCQNTCESLDLLINKDIPLEVYIGYADAKSEYEDDGYYKLSKCVSTDNKTYYEIKSGYYGMSITNIKNKNGEFVCSWGWDADCRDGCSIDKSGCPELKKCILLTGKSLD